MAHLLEELEPKKKQYIDKKVGPKKWEDMLKTTTTIYVGNMNFHSTEEQMYELFGRVGKVEEVVMGLNQKLKSPCGFCFVRFETHEEALRAKNLIRGTKIDGQMIAVDLDAGYSEGRQYGRAKSGGQWKDDFRGVNDINANRGGAGLGLLLQVQGTDKKLYIGKRDSERAFDDPHAKRQKTS